MHPTQFPLLLWWRTTAIPCRPRSQDLLGALRAGCARSIAATCTAPRAAPPLARLCVLLRVDLLHDLLDLIAVQHLDLLPRRHDGDLDVLSTRLHDFEEGLDGQLDGVGAWEVGLVVALEELADGFAAAADSVCFPIHNDYISGTDGEWE